MNKYTKYKFLKKKLIMQNKYNYPIERVMGSYLANFIWTGRIEKIRFLIFCVIYKHVITSDHKTLLTNPSSRRSYQTLLENYVSKNFLIDPKIVPIRREYRSFWNISLLLMRTVVYFKFFKDLNFSEMLICGFLKAIAVTNIEELEKCNFTCEKYICFNSSYLFESFLTFYFRKRQVPTLSIQHGLYYKYNNEVPFDVINYENVCADRLLCWGQYSIDQITSEIPFDVNLILDQYPYKIVKNIHKSYVDHVLVLLPRRVYLKEIKVLLKILSTSQEYFVVRPHPSVFNKIEKFVSGETNMQIDRNQELSDTLSRCQYKFCIGFNSTALLEALIYDQNIIQYISGNDEFIVEGVTAFRNQVEFSKTKDGKTKDVTRVKYYFNV